LHFDYEISSVIVLAADVDNGFFQHVYFRDQLACLVFYADYLAAFFEGQHAVDQAYAQVLVLSEYALERYVKLWV
jgi:hypothetical protein